MSMLLSGCFGSEQPKFPLNSAVPAFGDEGRYGVFQHVGADRYKRQATYMVRRLDSGVYEITNEKDEKVPVSFHDIGNGMLVGQARPHQGMRGFGYFVVKRAGKDIIVHVPQCDAQDKALLASFGVRQRGKYECLIDQVTDPVRLFAALKLGQPTSKMVPE